MKLVYEAYDKSGRAISDVIDASTMEDASSRLRRQGYFVTSIAPTDGDAPAAVANPPATGRKFGGGNNYKNRAIFTRQLAVLVASGMPLADGIGALERQMKNARWIEAVRKLRERVEEGEPLSKAMHEQSHLFDLVYCSLVEAGETSGKLAVMLDRLSMLTQQQARVRNSIVGALVYPALLVTISIAVLCLMLMFVLPRFAGLFDTLDATLPGTTKIMLSLGIGMRTYWWALLIVAVGIPVGIIQYMKTASGKRLRDTLSIRLPVIRKIVRSFSTARIARLFGILLESHLPLMDVLTLVKNSTAHSHYVALLGRAEEFVTHGEPVSTAFGDEKLIESSMYEALRSGEQSGRVGEVMLYMADYLDEENEVVLRSLTKIIEPAILIILGGLVGIVALSMFLPLFDLTAMASGG